MVMNKQKPIRITPPKPRMHRALFDQDLPFRPKVEKSPKQYQRKPKHRNQGENDV
jgi:stalled ribosome alternative rescue factor ArfA